MFFTILETATRTRVFVVKAESEDEVWNILDNPRDELIEIDNTISESELDVRKSTQEECVLYNDINPTGDHND